MVGPRKRLPAGHRWFRVVATNGVVNVETTPWTTLSEVNTWAESYVGLAVPDVRNNESERTMSATVRFDEMSWPAIGRDLAMLEWRLRYAPESLMASDHVLAAAVLAAYRDLATCPRAKRERVTRELRAACARGDSEDGNRGARHKSRGNS